tara:strand:- start:133 stop:843 length:711 start_codon:yes stop_codon:yes gene_type:complete
VLIFHERDTNQFMPHSFCTAVVFDFDGLMFNTEELYTEVGREILRRRGQQQTEELVDAMMGRTDHEALTIMIQCCGLEETVEQLQMETKLIFQELVESRLQPMPGLFELLDRLEAASIPKAIATSSRRATVRDLLSRFDLESRFEFLLGAENISQGKPDPEIYLEAIRRLGFPAERVLVLEDSYNGCQAGIQAGAFTVAVPAQHSFQQDFSNAALVVDDLKDDRIYQALGISRSGF